MLFNVCDKDTTAKREKEKKNINSLLTILKKVNIKQNINEFNSPLPNIA